MLMVEQLNVHRGWEEADIAPRYSRQSGIDVWRIALDAESLHIPELLSVQELARARSFAKPVRQRRYVVAHAALRRFLAAYSGIDVQAIVLGENAYGKPFLTGCEDLHFNLSHSDDEALIALSYDGPLGVDLEGSAKEFPWEIASQVFSKKERSHLNAHPVNQRSEAYFEAWCRKEALLKAHGVGLMDDLPRYDVLGAMTGDYFFYKLASIEGHASALVSSIGGLNLKMRRYRPSAMEFFKMSECSAC